MEGNEFASGGGFASGGSVQVGLITSSVPRSLDNKNRLFGFELPDLLFIFMNLAVTNLVFGSSSLRYPLVWGSTVFFALFLYFMKKDKPDNYLQHLGEYIVQPTVRLAGKPDLKHRPFVKEANSERKNEPGSKTGNEDERGNQEDDGRKNKLGVLFSIKNEFENGKNMENDLKIRWESETGRTS